jgi:flagellar hook-associated protein 1 FlgK
VGSLFSALNSASSALQAFQDSIDVTQNNVTNANSPGYAKQVPVLQSEDSQSSSGGVLEVTQDSRNQFADSAVRQQLSLLGQYQQLQTTLAPLQTVFDVSATSPIPSALNQLFQSFSQWSTQPSSADYQNAVLTAAQQTSTAFQQAASELSSIRTSTETDIQSTVTQINQDAAQVQAYNIAVSKDSTPNAGQSAQLESALENLSNLANVQVLPGIGGTMTVLLGGQAPLVIGTQVNVLQAQADSSNSPDGPPPIAIVDSNGNDVTANVTSGSLYSLLNVTNNVIPSLAGGGQQAGGLNTLAQSLADTVNGLLTEGSTTSTPPYQAGSPLFTYNSTSPSGVAASLNVNPALTPGQLAATDPGPPAVSNGIALQLAGLDSAPGGQINGMGFTQYFGTMVSQVGTLVSNASTSASAQTQVVTQAQQVQQQLSGVSIDEEAVRLVQLQSSYGAASKVVNIIDQMLQDLVGMVQ